MAKKKKKWTTKNTHIKKLRAKKYIGEPQGVLDRIGTWLILIGAIIATLLIALDSHIVGYDHFIGIPVEWIRSLYNFNR